MRPKDRAACEAALRNGDLEKLRALNEPHRGSSKDAFPALFASYYLPKPEAVRVLFEGLAINPTFRRGMRRLASLLDVAPSVRRTIEEGTIPDELIPAEFAAAFRGEATWAQLPAENGFPLPEPICSLNATYPIATRQRIDPRPLQATLVEGGLAYRDGHHFQAFKDGEPVNMRGSSSNVRLVVSAARKLIEREEWLEFEDTVHLVGGAGPRSFYHWLLDIVPLLQAGKTLFPDVPVRTIVTNGSGLAYQKNTLRLVASEAEILEYPRPVLIRAPRIVYATHRNGLGRTMPTWVLDCLRSLNTAPPQNIRRVYIARSAKAGRSFQPVEEVERIVRAHGFHVVQLETLSLLEQFSLFAGADIVAGVHGAGLSHTLFMRPRSVLVEIFGDHMTPSFQYLAGRSGVHYLPVSMVSRYDDVTTRSGDERNRTRFSDVTLDPDRLEAALDLAGRIASSTPAEV